MQNTKNIFLDTVIGGIYLQGAHMKTDDYCSFHWRISYTLDQCKELHCQSARFRSKRTVLTRTTFETEKPRRPRDQYKAAINKYIGSEWKKLHQSNQPGEFSNKSTFSIKKSLHCEFRVFKISSPMSHWRPDCQVCHLCCGCLVDTVHLPCAFAPIFMVQSHLQHYCQSI